MKQKNIQQEILIPIQTSFARKAIIQGNGGDQKASLVEELEKGFWNGRLDKMLPELMAIEDQHSKLFIWQIIVGETSLLIDMGAAPDIIDVPFSINHSFFLSLSRMN